MVSDVERWYDKNSNLSQVFNFLENIDKRNRKIIANEILQIIFSELNVNSNEKVKELSKLNHTFNKRWYDEDTEVQSAVEIIKTLSEEQKRELIERIIELLQQIVIKGEVA